jgi:hypothetical protein
MVQEAFLAGVSTRRVGVVLEPMREDNPPSGVTPIRWLLLTTVPTATIAQGCERIGWYACRWVAEMYHKVLKSGCRIERRQFDDLNNLRRYLAIDAIVAWRVLYMTMQDRETPTVPCTVILEATELQALYVFTFRKRNLPASVPTLSEAILWIAQLGGYHRPAEECTLGDNGYLAWSLEPLWHRCRRASVQLS